MNEPDLKNKKIAILGVGTEGLALADFLFSEAENLTLLDQLTEEEILKRLEGEELEKFKILIQDPKITKVFGSDYLNNLNDFDIIFRSPGISSLNNKIEEAKKSDALVSSQIKLFFELCPCQIIGVTGTKGKGTTASLIFQILKKNTSSNRKIYLAGNIGYPAITLIPKLKEEDIIILELSSFQLMDLEQSPHVAVVTNLSEDHLDYHKDVEEYKTAKFNILKFQTENDFAILNADSMFSDQMLGDAKSKKYFFSKTKNADAVISGEEIKAVVLDPDNRNIKICSQNEIKLFGAHNLENIAAAALVADLYNIPSDIIKKTAMEFTGLPHRLEFVAEIDGVKYINDSYATNPDPTIAAIDSFSENEILILGGSSKGADFSGLAEKISFSNVSAVILINPEGEKIKESLIAAGYAGKLIEGCQDIEEIINSAKKEAKKGDTIILSPACASFGMFKNYKERGVEFKEAVNKLKK